MADAVYNGEAGLLHASPEISRASGMAEAEANEPILPIVRTPSSSHLSASSSREATLVEFPLQATEEQQAIPRTTLPEAPYGWVSCAEFPKWYTKRLFGFDQSLDAYTFVFRWDQLIAFLFTGITLTVLIILQYYVFRHFADDTLDIFIPAFGATCTCLYANPTSPVSQPRSVIVAHLSAGVIGIAVVNAFTEMNRQPYGQHLAGAIGVGLHQIFMSCTHTFHPPASATVLSATTAAFQPYFHDRGFMFCVTPCLSGAVVCVIMAVFLNNLVPTHSPYPQYW